MTATIDEQEYAFEYKGYAIYLNIVNQTFRIRGDEKMQFNDRESVEYYIDKYKEAEYNSRRS